MELINGVPWWMVALMVCGVLALVLVTSALFLPDLHQPRMCADHDAAAESPEFLDHLATLLNVPVIEGGEARVLQNGDAFFTAMLGAISGATDTINFQCYIWESGSVSDQFIAALSAAATRGVEVRVLVDAFGGIKFKGEDRDHLRAGGVTLSFFRPLSPRNVVRMFKRSHQRAIVVDGITGYTGGAAVADKWSGDAGSVAEWRDSMLELEGALAATVQVAFAVDWQHTCGEVLIGPRFFPTRERDAEAADDDAPQGSPRGFGLVSSPSDAHQPIRTCFWASFRSARRYLYISSSYFIPDARLRGIVSERARNGVDVRILVPGGTTDARPVRYAGQAHYQELLEAGVRVYEYQATMMHAKTVVVDDVWSLGGSANLDERSMELNEENLVGICDATLACAIADGFRHDLERSTEINLEEWSRRWIGARIAEQLSRALIEQY